MSLSKERLLLEEQESKALLSGRRFPQRDAKKQLLNEVGELLDKTPEQGAIENQELAGE